jgi:hypothetical protein
MSSLLNFIFNLLQPPQQRAEYLLVVKKINDVGITVGLRVHATIHGDKGLYVSPRLHKIT